MAHNEPVLREWVNRLRSGDYEQGKSRLRQRLPGEDVDRFCCWGVLCEIAIERGIAFVDSQLNGDGYIGYFYGSPEGELENSVWPTADILQWSFGYDSIIEWADGRWEGQLADLNDKGVSFGVIADIIEKNITTEPQ